MRERLRTLVRPESAARPPRALRAREAVAAWVTGTVWAAACVGLWSLGARELLPVTLMGLMLTLSAWRGRAWLQWFPVAVAVASLLDVAAPVVRHPGFVPPRYVEIVAAAAALLVVARLIGRPAAARASGARGRGLALGLVAAAGVAAAAGAGVRSGLTALVTCGAACALAWRPAGARRVWMAFPAIAGLVGGYAVLAFVRDRAPGGPAMHAADAVWGCPGGLIDVLAVTVPAALGLAVDPAPRRRAFAWLGGLLGVAGLVARLASGGLAPATAAPPIAVVGAALLVASAWVAALGTRGRFRGWRWAGLGASLAAAAGIVLAGHPLASGTIQVAVALATGLAFGGAAAIAHRTRLKRTGPGRAAPPRERPGLVRLVPRARTDAAEARWSVGPRSEAP